MLPFRLALAALLLAFPSLLIPAHAEPGSPTPMDHVAWSRNANIYEVNVRQFTREGTFDAFAKELPRLRKMGVDILWLMPVQPIGIAHRSGELGSYYAVRDYTAVNPEFGTMADFKRLVQQAHALGFHVIIDWVANHSAFDNRWTTEHKDWYLHDAKGDIFPVTYREGDDVQHWNDVTGFDYTQPGLWAGMTDAMAFWVRETDIDGFRCDVAGKVPTPFWNQARAALDRIKPVFMLAEAQKVDLHEHAFDMTYGWDTGELFKQIAKGKADVTDLKKWVEAPPLPFPADAYRMRFTSNHDINSWQGSDTTLYGPSFKALTMLSATLPGMPLIYGGQESGLDKRIEFFKRDPIAWKDYGLAPFYSGLLALKKGHPALWNGQYGGDMAVRTTGNDKVFAFRRKRGVDTVDVVVNLSNVPQNYMLAGKGAQLGPWKYVIDATDATHDML